MSMYNLDPVKYESDDRDNEERDAFWIHPGGNGDWYVSTGHHKRLPFTTGVRICTSGGASRVAPILVKAIALLYAYFRKDKETVRLLAQGILDAVDNENSWRNLDEARSDKVLNEKKGFGG